MAVKHQRPWLHIDLSDQAAFQAASVINSWIVHKKIEILNVAGPRASKDSKIYQDVIDILESTYYLGMIERGMPGAGVQDKPVPEPSDRSAGAPATLMQAVAQLIVQMSLRDKATVANMLEDELPQLHLTLGGYIMNRFGLASGNAQLMKSCLLEIGGTLLKEEDAVAVIIKTLWQTLQQTHKLRVVK